MGFLRERGASSRTEGIPLGSLIEEVLWALETIPSSERTMWEVEHECGWQALESVMNPFVLLCFQSGGGGGCSSFLFSLCVRGP